MKLYNKKIMTLVALFVVLANGLVEAKVRAVNARRDFEQSIAKESMVVALFYDDKDRDLTRMYEDVSKTQIYDDADVIFLKINSARPELSKLASLYGVKTMPTFIFFHKGKRVMGNGGRAAVLTGNVSRDVLQSFIDEHYGIEIEQYVTQKNARNENRITQERERGSNWEEYFYPRVINTRGYGPEERMME